MVKKKKYMVRCDLEGASGIVSYSQAEPGKAEYAIGREMFMHDLLALLKGLREGGADEVVVYDEHCDGRNIDLVRLPVYAKAICGKPPYRAGWAGGLDETFAGLILLGFHSKAGTADGLLPHTYEWDIANLVLNGVSIGEIGMEAAIAGDFGVPAIMMAGDAAGAREAQALLPGIVGVPVKEGRSETGAACLAPALTAGMIRKAAMKAMKNENRIKPYNYGNNAVLEIVLRPGLFLNEMKHMCGKEFHGEQALRIRAKNVTAAWACYWKTKLACLKILGDKKQ
ncbi:MAG: M55 family metallopeptidase [Kiritimatiellae bacterium]|nr:M55 family metallopeptidase [Kiritimatiellia bacterium]